jgi:hypothetical protein
MYKIDAQFLGLDEIPFLEMMYATGVYVLWTRDALARPSYIGEGDVLARILHHRNEKPWGESVTEGVVAIMTSDNPKQRKHDAEVLEAMLLEAAEQIDCSPTYNTHPGKFKRVFARLGGFDKSIRARITGAHPFKRATSLREPAFLHARWMLEIQDYFLEQPWRMRLAKRSLW